MKFIMCVAIVLVLSGCKTTAQVQQEQKVQGISGQLVENQKLSANMTAQIQEIDHKVNILNGKIEELQHENMPGEKEDIQGSLKEMEERMTLMEKNLQLVRQELEAHRTFFESVNQSLKGVGAAVTVKPTKKKGEKSTEEVSAPAASGLDLFKAGKYPEAKTLLEKDLTTSTVTGKKRSQVLHSLGMIYFLEKNHDQAMILFSKLYKEFPTSPLNKTGLLHLGKSLMKKGEKEQAKNAFSMVIEKFPETSSAQEAKKLLAEIK